MRYDTPIFFQMVVPGEYDKKTGNYVDNQIKEVIRYASVKDTGVDTMKLMNTLSMKVLKSISFNKATTQ